MVPLIPLAIGAAVAGVGFAVGKKVTESVLIPWVNETAKGWGRGWDDFAEAARKRQLDEVDPPDKNAEGASEAT